jgi:hypothetical protein
VLRVAAASLAVVAIPLFHSVIRPLSPHQRARIVNGYWHAGCPVAPRDLRVLTVNHWGFDGRVHTGQLVVNEAVAGRLREVFRRLYKLRFPIRHMLFSDVYGPRKGRPADGDISGSFVCRDAVPSPCNPGTPTKHWSMHAYGEAVDINPVENPYVGCGQTRDKKSVSYMNRSRLRPGMVTPAVVQAFKSVGWGWGGDWSGDTKDYMHFSLTGH